MLTLFKYRQHFEWKLFCINHKWICIQGGTWWSVFPDTFPDNLQLNSNSKDGQTVFFSCLLMSKKTPIQLDPIAKEKFKHKLNPVLWISIYLIFFSPERIVIHRYCLLNYAVWELFKFREILRLGLGDLVSILWLFSYTELPSDWLRGQSYFDPPDRCKAPSSRTQWQ